MKKLLMLNASEHEIPFILAARKLGFYVITTSTKRDYAGHKYADEYIYGDYNNYEEMISLCKLNNIEAISQGCRALLIQGAHQHKLPTKHNHQ